MEGVVGCLIEGPSTVHSPAAYNVRHCHAQHVNRMHPEGSGSGLLLRILALNVAEAYRSKGRQVCSAWWRQ